MIAIIWRSLVSLIVWLWLWFYGYKKTLTEQAIAFKARIKKAKEIEEEIVEKAKLEADKIIERWETKAVKIEEWALKEIDKRHEKLDRMEERVIAKEEKLENNREKLEQDKEAVQKEMEEILIIKDEQKKMLSQVANLSVEDAKTALFAQVEIENEKELSTFINKFKTITKEEADTQAQQILARVLPRIATDHNSEFTTVNVDIPDEHFKWKIIGREWRNIAYFEKITGTELVVDDTPLLIRLSSFDHEKRFIAAETLKKLIKDTKINPHHIEKIYNEIVNNLDNVLLEQWKQALNILNIPMMKPEIVKMIWQFKLRYSYGQNLWNHSIEVAKISEAIATEMGLDPMLAKKAGLLHDIGKVIAATWQSHTAIWADTLKKHWMHPVIINAAEAHHYDVPMTDPITWIVTAADAISASRPWARFNTKDLFIDKMSELEKLIKDVDWVQKVHIMQAWREIMVYANPEKINDLEVQQLIKTIANKIEDQLDYPWIIRIVMFRETKVIEYIR